MIPISYRFMLRKLTLTRSLLCDSEPLRDCGEHNLAFVVAGDDGPLHAIHFHRELLTFCCCQRSAGSQRQARQKRRLFDDSTVLAARSVPRKREADVRGSKRFTARFPHFHDQAALREITFAALKIYETSKYICKQFVRMCILRRPERGKLFQLFSPHVSPESWA